MKLSSRFLVLILLMSLVSWTLPGCGWIIYGSQISGAKALDDLRNKNRTNLLRLSIGMSKEQVLSLMGTESVHASSFVSPSTVNNPYKSEILNSDKGVLEVLYFYTDLKKADGAITDDELTPLVFQEGKLLGWGNSFLTDTVQKYEIRVR